MTASYNPHIEDLLAGRWVDRQTGKPVHVPIQSIVIEDDLDGGEEDMIGPLGLGKRLAVVSDQNTYVALGERVERGLRRYATIDSIVLDRPHADSDAVGALRHRSRHADALVAVGSGTLNDLCKYATFLDRRDYAVFCTAASMNGYTSSTASITVDGFKTSQPAHNPQGIFMDLGVIAKAPLKLSRSGLGDCLCRSSAQVDWLLSHRLFDTFYHPGPFELQADDEGPLLDGAAGLAAGDLDFYRRLCRVLTLCGLGVCITHTSHHGSMAEHMISHYLDMFAGDLHPGSLHGEQVGVASLTMSRLQQQILQADAAPLLRPTIIDEAAVLARYGPKVGPQCLQEWRAKALDAAQADALNAKLERDWPQLRAELLEVMLPLEKLVQTMRQGGLPMSGEDLGLPGEFYRQAVLHARETRNRFSMLDIAGDAGLLETFVAGER